MYQTYHRTLSTKRLEVEGNDLVAVGLTMAVTLEGIFDEKECNVIRQREFMDIFEPWFALFEASPLDRYIKSPTVVNVAIFLATMTNRIVDTHVIRSMQIKISEGVIHSYTLDTRIPEDIGVATRGGPWRSHDLDSMAELARRFPSMFNLDEATDIKEELREAKQKMNGVINRFQQRRLKELLRGGGSLTQS